MTPPATLERQALRGSHSVRRMDVLLGLFALVVGLLVAKKSEETWTDAAASLFSLSHWNTLVTYAWFLRLLSALTLPDSIHWGIAAPFAAYVARTLPQACLLMLGPSHQLSPVIDEVVLQRHWPGALFCFLSLRHTHTALEVATLVFSLVATCILCAWYSNPATQLNPLRGINKVWPIIQSVLIGITTILLQEKSRRQRQLRPLPHVQQERQPPGTCGAAVEPAARDACEASGHGSKDAGALLVPAGLRQRATAGAGLGVGGLGKAGLHATVCDGAQAEEPSPSAVRAAAATVAPTALCPGPATGSAPQPQPQQPLQPLMGGSADPSCTDKLRQQPPPEQLPPQQPQPQQQAAALSAAAVVPPPAALAALLPGRPPPYRRFVRHTTHFVKVDGVEPEDLPPEWRERLVEAAARQGRVVTGIYMRRGCVELVVEFVQLQLPGAQAWAGGAGGGPGELAWWAAGAAGGGSGQGTEFAAAVQGVLAPVVLDLLQSQQLLRLPQSLLPQTDSEPRSRAQDQREDALVAAGAAAQGIGSAAAAPAAQAPFLAACTSFHGSFAGAACWVTSGGQTAAASPLGPALPPRFLSLHPRVAYLPPPPQQPLALGVAREQAPAARLLLLTLELWFPPSSVGAGADGGGVNGAGAEVLLRHHDRYLPVTVRRLPLGCGPGARRAVVRAMAVAGVTASPSEGRVERYEVDVRLGGGASDTVVLKPGLLQVDVRWGGLPCMSLPVLLLPSAAAAGGGAAVAAAAAGPAAVDLVAVGEELQRFCRWFGRRGEAAVTYRSATMATANGSGDGGGSACVPGVVEIEHQDADVDEDGAGGLLHDVGFVLYGDGPIGQRDSGSSSGSSTGGGGDSASGTAAAGGIPRAHLLAQRLAGRVVLAREVLQYADSNAMPHLAGLVAGQLVTLQEQLAAAGGGGGLSSSGLGSQAAVGSAGASSDGGSPEPPPTPSLLRSPSMAPGAAAAVPSLAWRTLLLFVGSSQEEKEEAAAVCEARKAWNLRNAPLIEVFELLTGLSMLARYYFPVAIGAQAPETFTGTVIFIGLVCSGVALVVFTTPLLLVAWVVLPLVLAVFGVPREGRERAAAQLQQLRQWVRAGPAIWLRYAAVVTSKALLLALRVSPPPMWRAYSAGLGMVAADGLLLPVACLLPPLPALLLSAVRMPVLATYLASPYSGLELPSYSGSAMPLDALTCGASGGAPCLTGATAGANASWARTAYAAWLAVRLEAVALAATWACHVGLRRLPRPPSRAVRAAAAT